MTELNILFPIQSVSPPSHLVTQPPLPTRHSKNKSGGCGVYSSSLREVCECVNDLKDTTVRSSQRQKLRKNCASLAAQQSRAHLPVQETWVQSLGREDLLEEGMAPTPVFLPGEFHRQRSLVGYRPWHRKEPDTTYQLNNKHHQKL